MTASKVAVAAAVVTVEIEAGIAEIAVVIAVIEVEIAVVIVERAVPRVAMIARPNRRRRTDLTGWRSRFRRPFRVVIRVGLRNRKRRRLHYD